MSYDRSCSFYVGQSSYTKSTYCRGPTNDMPKYARLNLGQIATKVMHPHLEYKCTLMILKNLLKPEWITVPCYDELVGDIMCMVKRKTDTQNKILMHFESIIYEKFCILIQKKCYTFTWMPAMNAFQINKGNLAETSNIKKYKPIFNAVTEQVPPILDKSFKYIIKYRVISNIFLMEKKYLHNKKMNVLVIQKTLGTSYKINENIIFRCNSGTLLSNIYVCDGKLDCPGVYPNDELNCTCSSNDEYDRKCKFIINRIGQVLCSLFYITFKDKSCQPTWKLAVKNQVTKKHDIKCSDTNNLYSDCGLGAKNQQAILGFSNYLEESTCAAKGQIPCRKGYNTCFGVSDICIYRLEKHSLIPCRTGGHIENCKHFECNMKVKCPGFYCIPYQYICDGKWDCPGGYDELKRDRCIEMKKCINMFKCALSETCIHVGDTCNGIADCPEGDDEHLCSLSNVICPPFCNCLHVTIVCFNTKLSSINSATEFPYQIVFVTYSESSSFTQFLPYMKDIRILSLQNNKLTTICNSLPSLKDTLLIDLGFNKIGEIKSKCFYYGFSITVLKLNNNQLTTFYKASILHLKSLEYLDLSSNNLRIIFNDFSDTYVSLKILIIFKNKFERMSKPSLKAMGIKLLLTNNYHLCCLISPGSICTAHVPWYTTCSSLLINGNIRVCYYLMSFIIIITNVLSFIIQKISNRNRLHNSFITITYLISFEDFLLGAYLIILWLNDLKYGKDFISNSTNWTSSGNCYILYFFFLHFNLVSPIALGLLSLSRFMVIRYPLTTQFKQNNFILKVVFGIFLLATLFTSLIILLILNRKESISFRLCSALVHLHRSTSLFIFIPLGLIAIQIFACAWNVVLYTNLWKALKRQAKEFNTVITTRQKLSIPLAQIFIFVSANVLCWFWGNIVYLAGIFMKNYPIEMIMWATITISPINSIIHPVVFVSMVSKRY